MRPVLTRGLRPMTWSLSGDRERIVPGILCIETFVGEINRTVQNTVLV